MNRPCLTSLIASLAVLTLTTVSSQGALTFNLRFGTNTGTNWHDVNYGSLARQTLQNSLNEFGLIFQSNAIITLDITSSQSASYYASASADSYNLNGTFYDNNIYTLINTGVDLNTEAVSDGSIDWSFNLDALGFPDYNGNGIRDVGDFAYNIRGLARHEVMHLFGMSSMLTPSAFAGSYFTRHDSFLFDSAGRPYVNTLGNLNSAASFNDANAYFDPAGNGPNYQVAFTNDFSHLMGVMYPYHSTMNADDQAYLSTLGYQLTGTPEPSSSALLFAGLAFLGARRRRLAKV